MRCKFASIAQLTLTRRRMAILSMYNVIHNVCAESYKNINRLIHMHTTDVDIVVVAVTATATAAAVDFFVP